MIARGEAICPDDADEEVAEVPGGHIRPDATGGEAACWAHLLCPECGAVLDGGPHRPGCDGG